MAVASLWLLLDGAFVRFSDFYPLVARPEGIWQMVAGITLSIPIFLAWARPRPWVLTLAVALSAVVSLPPIWNNLTFANEYGWSVGGQHVGISICFGILLAIACAGIHRVVNSSVASNGGIRAA